jgi:hypothetical protein
VTVSGAPALTKLCSAARGRESDSYGVADGEADGAALSVFLVEDFLVVVDFFVAGAVDFFFVVVAAVELLVVVVAASFLFAQDDIKKLTATKATTEQIRDCFIGCG